MSAKHFYAIVQSEENTVAFLKERGLIEIGTPSCVHCGSQTKFYESKERTVIRCIKKGCQSNTFFTYTDKNGLSSQILKLSYYWYFEIPQSTIIKLKGHGNHTVTDWINLCRDIPIAAFEKKSKMGGINTIVLVDESLMSGK